MSDAALAALYGSSTDIQWHRQFCIGNPVSCSDITAAWSGDTGTVMHLSLTRRLNEDGSSGLYSPGVVVMDMVPRMVCYW